MMKKIAAILALIFLAGTSWFLFQPTVKPDDGFTANLGDSTASTISTETPLRPSVSPEIADQTIKLWVVGDFGDPGNRPQAVADLAKSLNVDVVVTVGDNNYPTGAMEDFETNTDAHYWDWIISGSFFPALGNHDWGYHQEESYTADNLPHSQHFAYLPGNRRYYSATLGNGLVEIFVIDSDVREPDGRSAGSLQYQWLKQAMETSRAKYQLVFAHEPPFTSALQGHG